MMAEAVENNTERKERNRKSQFAEFAIPKKWDASKIEEEFFKAFERGEAHARKSDKEAFQSKLIQNIEKAATLSENIFHTSTNDYGVKAEKAFLRISSINHFEALITVQKEDFLKPQMLEVYNKSRSIKSAFNNGEFRIDFRFMPFSENVNSELINSDGYIFVYAG